MCALLLGVALARLSHEPAANVAVRVAAMATPAVHDGLNGAVKAYIRRMLAECGAGMKALILDPTTVRKRTPLGSPAATLSLRLRGCWWPLAGGICAAAPFRRACEGTGP